MENTTTKNIATLIILLILAINVSAQNQETKKMTSDTLIQNTHIIFNGADWSETIQKLNNDSLKKFTIVQIGDSHLQADWPTSHIRKTMQEKYGDGGRGLITPFKLSGTYQPSDYSITSDNNWKAAKFLRYPWTPELSFAGTALATNDSIVEIKISLNNNRTFDKITIYHNGTFEIENISDDINNPISYNYDNTATETNISLFGEIDAVKIKLKPEDQFIFNAVNVSNNQPGLIYHTIGNGGADMHQYNLIKNFGEGVAKLQPDLIILSLGTNDSYNNFTRERFSKNLDRLVKDLATNNPQAKLLLVTPMEIQMTKTSYVTPKGKGRKKRAKQKITTRQIVPGTNIIHDMMLQYAAENQIPIYDWYKVAGGEGASKRWVEAGLMRSDYVHLTQDGYRLYADLLTEALLEALNNKN